MKDSTDNSTMAENNSLSGDVDKQFPEHVNGESSTRKDELNEDVKDNTTSINLQDNPADETDTRESEVQVENLPDTDESLVQADTPSPATPESASSESQAETPNIDSPEIKESKEELKEKGSVSDTVIPDGKPDKPGEDVSQNDVIPDEEVNEVTESSKTDEIVKQNSAAEEEKSESEITVETEIPAEDQIDKELTAEVDSESKTGEKDGDDEKEGSSDENDEITVKDVDYTTFSIDELVNTLTILISDRPVQEIRNDVEKIKVNFYKKHKIELEQKKKAFLAEGGDIIDFMPGEDPRETQVKDLLARYRNLKSAFNKDLEVQKQNNLKEKYQIIEEIKDLVNRKESINKTFQEFRDLQTQWREVGVVPQQNLKDLWETYHHHVEKFYDYIKINKELRDLDLKKNQEAKIKLCEKAEELILEPSVVNAFKLLQKLHDRWREIGPVPHEAKSELWERFREATSKINKKHQEFYEDLKNAQKKNLEAKTHLCEQVEEINKQSFNSHKEWDKKSTEVMELQKIWRTIGYAPKKSNTKIYQRFRDACDNFFKSKREFYTENKEIQNNNLQQKIELCIQAEGLQNSDEWKKTTEDLIQLQKKWKEIGPVPRKHSEKVWKRFRAACDTFFQKKSEYYSQIDTTYEDNLKIKKGLIEEISNFAPVENMEDNFSALKEYQRKWTEIGYVPFKQKDEILQEYRNAINKAFDSLKVGENQKNLLKYRNKLANIRENPKAELKIRQDREKFINKIKQLEGDIVLWENNIGFFAKSKNADSMIKEVHDKIDRAKSSIILLEEKVRLIDQSETDY